MVGYTLGQVYNARKVNFSCVYSAYIMKLVLSGRNLLTRIDSSALEYPRKLKASNFDNSHKSFL